MSLGSLIQMVEMKAVSWGWLKQMEELLFDLMDLPTQTADRREMA